jgi:hypothetical protein
MQILTLAHVYCKTIVGRNEKKKGSVGIQYALQLICTSLRGGGVGWGGGRSSVLVR